MPEHTTSLATSSSPRRWPDLAWLLLLLILALGLRGWQLTNTEVLSRDSIGFLRIAWRLGEQHPGTVLREAQQHPGYPLLVRFAGEALAQLAGLDDPVFRMRLAAQLISALAGVLLVVPMFYLGKRLFDARVGFWSALLFQCLPASGTLLVDGLSESLFLFFAATCLACAGRAFQSGSPTAFALAGLAGDLAYLTRLEGALLPGLVGLVLVGGALAAWRRTAWVGCLRGGAALTLGFLLVAAPYMATIGGVTRKPTARNMMGEKPHTEPEARGVATIPWAVWNFDENVTPDQRKLWAVWAVGYEMNKLFFYVLWLPALLGLWCYRDRLQSEPLAWVYFLLIGVLLLLLYRVAWLMGYLSARHGVLILLAGLPWAVAFLGVVGNWLAARWGRPERGVVLATGLLVLLVAIPLARTLAPLHGDRAAYRQAGLWLAAHAETDAEIVDPHTWAAYYSGYVFREHRPVNLAAPIYVVLEESRNVHNHLWLHRPRAVELAKRGTVAVRFPVERRRSPGEVKVYRVER